ncbi:MAG: GH3 auxin-responsive promoter family protein [Erysipelotrichaceae bacterium]|nr:GH3 auxin-responsive promoter family protein [Erysipelotrichaceae bacterium]
MPIRDLESRIVVKGMILKGQLDLYSMIRNTIDARKKNEKLLFKILKNGKNSEFGKKHDFASIKTIEDYRRQVPITTFEDYEEYAQRTINNNEQNLLTSLPIISFVETTGTTGHKKFIPITQKDVNIYTKYTVTRMLATAEEYHRKHGNPKKPFRGMFISPAFDRKLPNGMIVSNIPDIAAKQLGFLYPYILNVPYKKLFKKEEIDFKYLDIRFALEDRDTLYIFSVFFRGIMVIVDYLKKNWQILVDDIENGTINEISEANEETLALLKKTVKPNPKRASELRKEFEKGFDETLFSRIWPNMEVICGLGTGAFASFCEESRNYTKGIPYDFSIYGASEGLFGAVDKLEDTKTLLLIDSCYYEFIPVDDETKVLSLDELEENKEYEIIITNQAGLYRYSFGDVIKVVGFRNECPYVQFSYRKGYLLNLTGEKTTEEQVNIVVNEVASKAGCSVNGWAVHVCSDALPYHYEILMENNAGIDLSGFSDIAEEKLKELNLRYSDMRRINMIGKITISNLESGTQEGWINRLIEKGAPVTQVKPARILSSDESREFYIKRIRK